MRGAVGKPTRHLFQEIIMYHLWFIFQQWIKKQMVGRDSHWIGLTDLERESEWRWLDGTSPEYKLVLRNLQTLAVLFFTSCLTPYSFFLNNLMS